jgi:predicted MFS family arabinose efflux permease
MTTYLLLPKTEAGVYAVSTFIGFTFLGTVPPTIQVLAKHFGTAHLGTLFGLALSLHQVGGFLGAWVGGYIVAQRGDYLPAWWGNLGLCILASLSVLLIRDPKPRPSA